MAAKTGKRKAKARQPTPRPADKPDPLQRKLHDLANSLEAISLARQFIDRRPEIVPVLEKLAGALRDARTTLHQMDATLRGAPALKRHAAAR